MVIACWSAKGGSGTTVVAASLALLLASRGVGETLLVDMAGDLPATLGLPEPASPGVAGWLSAGDDVPPDALARLEERAAPDLALLPRGAGPLPSQRGDVLGALLAGDHRRVVVDCGSDPEGTALTIAAGATRSVLVTRPCFLSLRRAMAAPVRPSEVVLVSEPGRALSRPDVESCLGVPVVAEVAVDPKIARAVDAGLLSVRLPKGLARDLNEAA